jgi:hypothetical protein
MARSREKVMRMPTMRIWLSGLLLASVVGHARAQEHVTAMAGGAPTATAPAVMMTNGATQQKLLELVRVSPTLAKVVAEDPSLLSDTEYVQKNNPDLAAFLGQHPEVVRNPGYYLFSDLREQGQQRYDVMTPKSGFEPPRHEERSELEDIANNAAPIVAFGSFLLAVFWLTRLLLENRRWTKIFGMQSSVHGQLIEKFGTSQELLTYMGTEAGKRFLEAAPIATEFDQKRLPNVVSRVLVSVQIGVVMVMLGVGLLALRNSGSGVDAHRAILALGTIVLMPGLGFILSAGVTWVVAKRLGLMPDDASVREQQ